MTSYQRKIHTYTNFKIPDENKGTFGSPLTNRAKTKTQRKPTTIVPKKKIYSITGTAPAPSKDFFELVVHKDEVIFRKWRIKFAKNGKVVPSEDRLNFDSFLDSDVIQNEIERNLGDDALHMAIGHITQIWLPRLPIKTIGLITSYLGLRDIGNLCKVCSVFNKRLQHDAIWEYHLLRDFNLSLEDIAKQTQSEGKKRSLKYIYRQELNKMKEAEIDWDNV